jgi:hypothetical protein
VILSYTLERILGGNWLAQLWRDGRFVSGASVEAASVISGALLRRRFPGASLHDPIACRLAPCRPCHRDEDGDLVREGHCNARTPEEARRFAERERMRAWRRSVSQREARARRAAQSSSP